MARIKPRLLRNQVHPPLRLAGCIVAVIVAFVTLASNLGAQETYATPRIYRYACLDVAGRSSGSIEIQIKKRDNGCEIVSKDSSGLRGFARLGRGMIQEEVRLDTASGRTLLFQLTSSGDAWDTEGGSGKAISRKGNTCLGDQSFFYIVPTLIDPKISGNEMHFVLVRPEGGQRATMRLRVEGIVDAPDFYGKKEMVYRISMELADPIGRLFWPYTYNYYYRVKDLLFFAYDGPDENRMTSRIILMEAQG